MKLRQTSYICLVPCYELQELSERIIACASMKSKFHTLKCINETLSFSSWHFLISVDFQSNLKFIFGVNWLIDICVQVFEADSWQVCGEWLYPHLLPSWSDQGEQALSQLASRCLSGVWQEVSDASVSERFMSALTTVHKSNWFSQASLSLCLLQV